MKRTKLIRQVEERFGKPLPQILRGLYAGYQSMDLVAAHLEIEPCTAYAWLHKCGLVVYHELVPADSLERRAKVVAGACLGGADGETVRAA